MAGAKVLIEGAIAERVKNDPVAVALAARGVVVRP